MVTSNDTTLDTILAGVGGHFHFGEESKVAYDATLLVPDIGVGQGGVQRTYTTLLDLEGKCEDP